MRPAYTAACTLNSNGTCAGDYYCSGDSSFLHGEQVVWTIVQDKSFKHLPWLACTLCLCNSTTDTTMLTGRKPSADGGGSTCAGLCDEAAWVATAQKMFGAAYSIGTTTNCNTAKLSSPTDDINSKRAAMGPSAKSGRQSRAPALHIGTVPTDISTRDPCRRSH